MSHKIKSKKKYNALEAVAKELGFNSISEAVKAGYGEELELMSDPVKSDKYDSFDDYRRYTADYKNYPIGYMQGRGASY